MWTGFKVGSRKARKVKNNACFFFSERIFLLPCILLYPPVAVVLFQMSRVHCIAAWKVRRIKIGAVWKVKKVKKVGGKRLCRGIRRKAGMVATCQR